jgi:hypothetical protein
MSASEYPKRMSPTQSHVGRREFQAAALILETCLTDDETIEFVRKVFKEFESDGIDLSIKDMLDSFKSKKK